MSSTGSEAGALGCEGGSRFRSRISVRRVASENVRDKAAIASFQGVGCLLTKMVILTSRIRHTCHNRSLHGASRLCSYLRTTWALAKLALAASRQHRGMQASTTAQDLQADFGSVLGEANTARKKAFSWTVWPSIVRIP